MANTPKNKLPGLLRFYYTRERGIYINSEQTKGKKGKLSPFDIAPGDIIYHGKWHNDI
jgi:hypothetical protein